MRKFKDLLNNTFDKRKVWAGQRHRLLLYSPPCCQQGTLVWALTRQPSPMLLTKVPFNILSIQYIQYRLQCDILINLTVVISMCEVFLMKLFKRK